MVEESVALDDAHLNATAVIEPSNQSELSGLDTTGDEFCGQLFDIKQMEWLVYEIEKMPVIWHRQCPGYMKRAVQNEAWERLWRAMGRQDIEPDDIRHEWQRLRHRYVKARRAAMLMVDKNPELSPYEDLAQNSWPLFAAMRYLEEGGLTESVGRSRGGNSLKRIHANRFIGGAGAAAASSSSSVGYDDYYPPEASTVVGNKKTTEIPKIDDAWDAYGREVAHKLRLVAKDQGPRKAEYIRMELDRVLFDLRFAAEPPPLKQRMRRIVNNDDIDV